MNTLPFGAMPMKKVLAEWLERLRRRIGACLRAKGLSWLGTPRRWHRPCGKAMSELPKYFEDDQIDTCPFCGQVYPGEEVEGFEEWWAPTECSHMCCLDCTVWTEDVPLCPQCAREESQRNGKPA